MSATDRAPHAWQQRRCAPLDRLGEPAQPLVIFRSTPFFDPAAPGPPRALLPSTSPTYLYHPTSTSRRRPQTSRSVTTRTGPWGPSRSRGAAKFTVRLNVTPPAEKDRAVQDGSTSQYALMPSPLPLCDRLTPISFSTRARPCPLRPHTAHYVYIARPGPRPRAIVSLHAASTFNTQCSMCLPSVAVPRSVHHAECRCSVQAGPCAYASAPSRTPGEGDYWLLSGTPGPRVSPCMLYSKRSSSFCEARVVGHR
ncbi:hypothetical protein C2E23DRAFT_553184 [Lenzites betulinus]|nr:hypothetical protein C2E23DRAFT_553184 [Lenzites betulinus]